MSEKVKTSISIDREINDAIAKIAEEEDRSFSQQLNNILKDFLKRRDTKKKPDQED